MPAGQKFTKIQPGRTYGPLDRRVVHCKSPASLPPSEWTFTPAGVAVFGRAPLVTGRRRCLLAGGYGSSHAGTGRAAQAQRGQARQGPQGRSGEAEKVNARVGSREHGRIRVPDDNRRVAESRAGLHRRDHRAGDGRKPATERGAEPRRHIAASVDKGVAVCQHAPANHHGRPDTPSRRRCNDTPRLRMMARLHPPRRGKP